MTDNRKLLRACAVVAMLLCQMPGFAEKVKAKIGTLNYLIDTDRHTAKVLSGKVDNKTIMFEELKGYNVNYAPGRVVIPSAVEYAGRQYPVTAITEEAFYGSPIEEVVIPESVTLIKENAFRESKLRKATILSPKLKMRNWVFMGCENLTEVVLPDGLAEIPEEAFKQTALRTIAIPNSVTKIGGGAFSKCHRLETLTFPPDVTAIPWSVCYDCPALRSVSLPDGITTIGSNAFNNCTALTNINFPTSLIKIEYRAFMDCHALPFPTLPDNVTVGEDAFKGTKRTINATKRAKTSPSRTSPSTPQQKKKKTSIYD